MGGGARITGAPTLIPISRASPAFPRWNPSFPRVDPKSPRVNPASPRVSPRWGHARGPPRLGRKGDSEKPARLKKGLRPKNRNAKTDISPARIAQRASIAIAPRVWHYKTAVRGVRPATWGGIYLAGRLLLGSFSSFAYVNAGLVRTPQQPLGAPTAGPLRLTETSHNASPACSSIWWPGISRPRSCTWPRGDCVMRRCSHRGCANALPHAAPR